MGYFALQKGPCSFSKLRTSPWKSSTSPSQLFLSWCPSFFSPPAAQPPPYPLLPLSLLLRPVWHRAARVSWALARGGTAAVGGPGRRPQGQARAVAAGAQRERQWLGSGAADPGGSGRHAVGSGAGCWRAARECRRVEARGRRGRGGRCGSWAGAGGPSWRTAVSGAGTARAWRWRRARLGWASNGRLQARLAMQLRPRRDSRAQAWSWRLQAATRQSAGGAEMARGGRSRAGARRVARALARATGAGVGAAQARGAGEHVRAVPSGRRERARRWSLSAAV
jgi:hypothetical protein